MKVSKKADCILPSLTRKLFNMAKNYDDVIDLTLGDPDLPPPEELCNAAYEAMKNNKLKYSANAGLIAARRAASKNIERIWGIKSNPDSDIIITVGGMEALYLSIMTLLDPGDEVIVFAPYYVNYVQMVEMCDGKPVIINSYDEDKGICITRDMVENAVTDKTRAIIINSPNNPTGDVVSKDALCVIADIADKYDLAIISDEVYRTLLFENKEHQSILQFDKAKGRTILIDSLSKEYSMTGWRIGYAYGPQEVIANMVKFQENVAACANLSSQYALIEAYEKQIPNDYIVNEFQNRVEYLFNEISKIELLKPLKPKGTFYMFVNISKTNMKSEEFAYALLEREHIAVVPGKSYGSMYDDYIRLALTQNVSRLAEAVDRIKHFIETIQK